MVNRNKDRLKNNMLHYIGKNLPVKFIYALCKKCESGMIANAT